ncbi:unnamed protein product [Lymnaea stagnalis]|uniref:Claudin n=1 Tax=Lymnaea stagnalis TaxID=6523 RepID=A0AAV2HJ97_LYMST
MRLKDITAVHDDDGLKGTSRMWRASMLITLLGLISYVIGFSTQHWCSMDHELSEHMAGVEVNAHFGLWTQCITLTVLFNGKVIKDDCENLKNDKAWKPASKSLCSIGLILSTLGLVFSFLAGCRQNMLLMTFGGGLLMAGAMISAIGSGLFVGKAKHEDDRLEPGYSVYFALTGSGLLVVGGGMQLLSIRHEYSSIA